MKTRIKKIEYSDGRVEYIPQIKKFRYEVGFDQSLVKMQWWIFLIPIIGTISFLIDLPETLFWQNYNTIYNNEESAREVLDNALEEYEALIKSKIKVTKKVNYIKHP